MACVARCVCAVQLRLRVVGVQVWNTQRHRDAQRSHGSRDDAQHARSVSLPAKAKGGLMWRQHPMLKHLAARAPSLAQSSRVVTGAEVDVCRQITGGLGSSAWRGKHQPPVGGRTLDGQPAPWQSAACLRARTAACTGPGAPNAPRSLAYGRVHDILITARCRSQQCSRPPSGRCCPCRAHSHSCRSCASDW
jgi:hypothetical protein